MSEELVTIAQFSQPIDAHIARLRLEEEEIECFILDEYAVGANWLYSNAVGGVKLQVQAADAEKAREVMKAPPHPDPETVETATVDVEHCPRCQSTEVRYESFSKRLFFLSWLILNFPIPFLKRKWSCEKCGFAWRG